MTLISRLAWIKSRSEMEFVSKSWPNKPLKSRHVSIESGVQGIIVSRSEIRRLLDAHSPPSVNRVAVQYCTARRSKSRPIMTLISRFITIHFTPSSINFQAHYEPQIPPKYTATSALKRAALELHISLLPIISRLPSSSYASNFWKLLAYHSTEQFLPPLLTLITHTSINGRLA